jgi:hypothetical protein
LNITSNISVGEGRVNSTIVEMKGGRRRKGGEEG